MGQSKSDKILPLHRKILPWGKIILNFRIFLIEWEKIKNYLET
jgi:hypothetical protein